MPARPSKVPRASGRRAELARLWDAVHRPSSVTFIEGPAGIGKSRLVRELCDLLADSEMAVLVGRCTESSDPGTPEGVLAALGGSGALLARCGPLSRVTGDLGFVLPGLADVLPEPIDVPRPAVRRHRLFRAVREVLGAIGPVVLIVEDVHWADDETVDLLRFLLSGPLPNLALVVTYRGEDMRSRFPLGRAYTPFPGMRAPTVRLGALTTEETRLMAGALLGVDDLDPAFVDRLCEVTGGVPSLIKAVLRSVPNPVVRLPALVAHGDGIPVPAGLRETIRRRLATTTRTTRRVVGAAAVLGTPVTVADLAAVTGSPEDAVLTALDQAGSRDLLVETSPLRYEFRHHLARLATHDVLDPDERRELHRRCLAELAGRSPRPLARLAEHARRCGDRESWLRHGEAAADAAAESEDVVLATALLRGLLAAPWPTRDIDRLAVKLGGYAIMAIEPPDTAEVLAELVVDSRLSAAVRGEVRFYLGIQLLRTGRVAAARSEWERAMPELAGKPGLMARCVALLMLPYHGTASLEDVSRWSGIAEAHLASTGDQELRWSLRANILSTRVLVGEPSAVAEIRSLAPVADAPGARRQVARMYLDCADGCVAIGRFDDARSLWDAGTRWARPFETPHVDASEKVLSVRVDWFTGNWSGLAERARAVRDQHLDLVSFASEMSLVLGWLATVAGRWDEAEEHLLRTRAHRHREAFTILALGGHGGLIRTALGRRDVVTACAESDGAMSLLRHKGIWTWCGEVIEAVTTAYLAAGRLDDARDALDEAEAGMAGRDAPLSAAAISAGRGRLAEYMGEFDTAATCYGRARDLYEGMNAPYFAALMTEATAMNGHGERALSMLTKAADTYRTLGASRDENRCTRRIQALGGSRRKVRRGRVGYGSALSPRELEIARLIVAGLNNRSIARKLTLSLRTVEHHVHNVLRKLEMPSRYDVRPWHIEQRLPGTRSRTPPN